MARSSQQGLNRVTPGCGAVLEAKRQTTKGNERDSLVLELARPWRPGPDHGPARYLGGKSETAYCYDPGSRWIAALATE